MRLRHCNYLEVSSRVTLDSRWLEICRHELEIKIVDLESEVRGVQQFLSEEEDRKKEISALEDTIEFIKGQHESQMISLKAKHAEDITASKLRADQEIAKKRQQTLDRLEGQMGDQAVVKMRENRRILKELQYQCQELEKLRLLCQTAAEQNKYLAQEATRAKRASKELVHKSCQIRCLSKRLRDELRRIGSAPPPAPPGGSNLSGEDECSLSTAIYYKLASMTDEERDEMLRLRKQMKSLEEEISTYQSVTEDARRRQQMALEQLSLERELYSIIRKVHRDALRRMPTGTRVEAWSLQHTGLPEKLEEAEPRVISSVALLILSLLVRHDEKLPPIQHRNLDLAVSSRPTGIPAWDEAAARKEVKPSLRAERMPHQSKPSQQPSAPCSPPPSKAGSLYSFPIRVVDNRHDWALLKSPYIKRAPGSKTQGKCLISQRGESLAGSSVASSTTSQWKDPLLEGSSFISTITMAESEISSVPS